MTRTLTGWLGAGCGAVLLALFIWLAWQKAEVAPMPADAPTLAATPGLPWFVDVAQKSGITFQHFNSATPHHYIHETVGSGLGWIDYNNDGWLDLFVVQDGPLPVNTAIAPSPLAGEGRGGGAPTNKLYRNNGNGTFTDVTDQLGLARSGYGMGCAVGDYDNDGWDDLAVTYLGGNVLYRNVPATRPSPSAAQGERKGGAPLSPSPARGEGKGGGERRFQEVTSAAGLDNNPHWATACAWGDIDNDGFLDLYVCNYVEADLDNYPECTVPATGVRRACSPTYFRHVTHRLYRNNGDGTFRDISVSSGVAAALPSPGLAVLTGDLDGDGRLDIYVANDLKPAYLFHNQGGGRFIETAVQSGCGMDATAILPAGMGIDAGDLDGSGRPSLFLTNFQNKPNLLFLNRGNLRFEESSMRSGLGAPSLSRLSFGTAFLDADLDGNLDIAVANGHIQRDNEKFDGTPAEQEAQLFLGDGRAYFRDVSSQAGAYFTQRLLGRGLAWADFDNDGRPDLAFSHNGGPVALLHNRTETANSWIGFQLVGDGLKSNRNAVGTRLEIEYAGRRQVRFINGGGSYLSANDRRVLAGLSTATRAERVTIAWPSGRTQQLRSLEARRWYLVREGQEPAPVAPMPGP